MKNLMIWGALVFSAAITPASAQELQQHELPVETDYAVNMHSNAVQKQEPEPMQHGDDDAVRIRTISKTFPADRSDKVLLNNQYGSMVIKIWDKREVKIDVTVKAYSNNEKEAQELIDQVNISAGKEGDVISCKTMIDQNNSGRWFSSRNRKREIKVGYVVYLPATNALSLSQQYGSVHVDDFSGPFDAKVQYGDLIAGNLSGINNTISVQYGKTNIGELNKATIRQQYGSGLTIGTAGTLNLNAQYANVNITTVRGDAVIRQQYGSGLKIGAVGNLDLDVQYASVNISTVKGVAVIKQQYNSLTIGSAGKLTLKSQYTGVNIGALRGDGNFRMSYNNFTVAEISPACKRLTIETDYVDVNLNFGDSFSGEFNLQKSYGGFKYGNNVRLTSSNENEENKHSGTKRYAGKIGNGGSSAVQINADYGSVTFK
jgi:hypothetical protein